jgi:hypothetical protein
MTITCDEPRPRAATREICRKVAEELLGDLMSARAIRATRTEADRLAENIASVLRDNPHADGFRLTCELERRFHWDGSTEICELLDNAQSLLSREVANAQRAWAKRNSISPPLPIGASVMLTQSREHETGVITGVSGHTAAAYEIAIDGDPRAAAPTNCRRIVFFEDVAPNEPAAPAPSS